MYNDAQEVFDQIQHEIGQHNGEDLIKHLLLKLNQRGSTDLEEMRRYAPWNLLLLVKWTTLHGDFSVSKSNQPVPEHVVTRLLNLMHALNNQVSEFRTIAEFHLYLRKLAYQQFWLQARESIPFGIAFQYLLFGELPADHPFQTQFEDLTGVTIDDFIHLAFAVFRYLLIDDSRILLMKEWFFAEAKEYGWDVIESFFDAISVTTEDAQLWLAKHENDKNAAFKTIASEYFEHSPFARYPLFKHDGKYFVISPTLLLHSLSTFIHDELRSIDSNTFMDKFGNMFEKLLERLLRSTGISVLTEDDLLNHFGRISNQRVVDFLVSDNGCTIFIEAKGVTMRWEGMVAQLPGTIRNLSKSSILKGIRQAYNLADRIQAGDTICGTQIGQGENYLLIVTMKDFFVGNGQDFRNHIAPADVDNIKAEYGHSEPIPLENMFFVSIDELNTVLGEIAHGSWGFSQLMQAAVARGNTFGGYPAFRQLITESNGDIHPPPVIQQAIDELFQRSDDVLNKNR